MDGSGTLGTASSSALLRKAVFGDSKARQVAGEALKIHGALDHALHATQAEVVRGVAEDDRGRLASHISVAQLRTYASALVTICGAPATSKAVPEVIRHLLTRIAVGVNDAADSLDADLRAAPHLPPPPPVVPSPTSSVASVSSIRATPPHEAPPPAVAPSPPQLAAPPGTPKGRVQLAPMGAAATAAASPLPTATPPRPVVSSTAAAAEPAPPAASTSAATAPAPGTAMKRMALPPLGGGAPSPARVPALATAAPAPAPAAAPAAAPAEVSDDESDDGGFSQWARDAGPVGDHVAKVVRELSAPPGGGAAALSPARPAIPALSSPGAASVGRSPIPKLSGLQAATAAHPAAAFQDEFMAGHDTWSDSWREEAGATVKTAYGAQAAVAALVASGRVPPPVAGVVNESVEEEGTLTPPTAP